MTDQHNTVDHGEEAAEITALRYIKHCVETRGYPPSQREIATACGWAGASSAHNLLKIMEARGYIAIATGVPRGLTITPLGMKAMTEEL